MLVSDHTLLPNPKDNRVRRTGNLTSYFLEERLCLKYSVP